MMSEVKPIPDESSALIPMLVYRDVAAAIDFSKTALGAKVEALVLQSSREESLNIW